MTGGGRASGALRGRLSTAGRLKPGGFVSPDSDEKVAPVNWGAWGRVADGVPKTQRPSPLGRAVRATRDRVAHMNYVCHKLNETRY